MNTDELFRKYQLAENYAELRKEQLEYIIKASKGQIEDRLLRGMLMLIAETDSWKTSYEALLEKNKQKAEDVNG